MNTETFNTRVLIIDDDEIVRDNIEEILVFKGMQRNAQIASASSILFDDDDYNHTTISNHILPVFTVSKAINGMDGLEKVKMSIATDNPYAVIFLDMRMPGWDGLETVRYIKEVDSMAEIIIVTAYSDKYIEEIIEKAGQSVGYHVKPYASEEILQLATKAVHDYNKLRNLEKLISVISRVNLCETKLSSLLTSIMEQFAIYIGSDTAVIGILSETSGFQRLYSTGLADEELSIERISEILPSVSSRKNEVVQMDDLIFVNIEGYLVFTVLKNDSQLKTEKRYLLKLFIQNAAKAINNIRLHEDLMQKEKLSAVGNAMGMLMHDLRAPIKYIPILTGLIIADTGPNKVLDMINGCAEQASEIFDDFLDFIKEAPLVLQPVGVDQLIKDSIVLVNSALEIGPVLLHQDVEPGLMVQADNSKLKRVIMNLVKNAVEVLQDHKVPHATIDITAKKTSEHVVIEITDNGPGIPDKLIGNLFEAFVTADKSNGTGLGLAIVKQYITAHGGTIGAVNKRGAQFTIKLPNAEEVKAIA